jgi:hypothetical protein
MFYARSFGRRPELGSRNPATLEYPSKTRGLEEAGPLFVTT